MNLERVLARCSFCLLTLLMLTTTATPGGIVAVTSGQPPTPEWPASPAVPAFSPGQGLAAMGAITATVTTYSWAKTWGGSAGEVMAKSVAVDASGNLFMAGEFRGTVNFDPAKSSPGATFTSHNGTVDAFLSKFDTSGRYLWAKTWGAGYTNGACPNASMGCGRDAANAVVVDGSGNAYVAGLYQNTLDLGNSYTATSNAPNGSNNIFLAKFAADGATQWLRAWGGKTGGEAYSLALDTARGYLYVEGDWSTSPTTGTVDFNPGGPDGQRQNHGFYDAFLGKYDLNGNFQWVRTWGGSQYDDGPGVSVDEAGNVYVCGMYGSQDINFDPAGTSAGLGHPASDNSSMLLDVFLIKFDGGGNFQWVRTWGGQGAEDSGATVAIDQAGYVYAIGRFSCTNCNFNAGASGPITSGDLHSTRGDFDAFLSKFDANGNFQWAATWGGSQIDIADAIAVDGANDVYVGALVAGTRGGLLGRIVTSDASFAKFTPNGTLQWTKTWGDSGADSTWSLTVDGARNVYVAGNFQGAVDFDPDSGVDNHTAAGVSDAFLSKFGATSIVLTATLYLPLAVR